MAELLARKKKVKALLSTELRRRRMLLSVP